MKLFASLVFLTMAISSSEALIKAASFRRDSSSSPLNFARFWKETSPSTSSVSRKTLSLTICGDGQRFAALSSMIPGLIANCSFTSRQKDSLPMSAAPRRLAALRSALAEPVDGKTESAAAPPAKPLRKDRRVVDGGYFFLFILCLPFQFDFFFSAPQKTAT